MNKRISKHTATTSMALVTLAFATTAVVAQDSTDGTVSYNPTYTVAPQGNMSAIQGQRQHQADGQAAQHQAGEQQQHQADGQTAQHQATTVTEPRAASKSAPSTQGKGAGVPPAADPHAASKSVKGIDPHAPSTAGKGIDPHAPSTAGKGKGTDPKAPPTPKADPKATTPKAPPTPKGAGKK